MRSFAEWGPGGVRLLESKSLSEDAAACVAEVTETTTKDAGSIKFRLHDEPTALTLIAKHFGMFSERAKPDAPLQIMEILHIIVDPEHPEGREIPSPVGSC